MFYIITHKLHGEDLGAIIEAESEDQAFRVLFSKGNFGEENEKFLLKIKNSDNINDLLNEVKYMTISNNRKKKKNESLIIQWWKGWGERILEE